MCVCVCVCVYLLSYNIMSLRFIHVTVLVVHSSLLLSSISVVWINHNLFIHFHVGFLDCFQCVANMNKAAMNILAYDFWCTRSLVSFEHIPWSGIVRSQGRLIFSFSRYCQMIFQDGCTNLNSTKSSSCSTFSPTLGFFLAFKILATFVGA